MRPFLFCVLPLSRVPLLSPTSASGPLDLDQASERAVHRAGGWPLHQRRYVCQLWVTCIHGNDGYLMLHRPKGMERSASQAPIPVTLPHHGTFT